MVSSSDEKVDFIKPGDELLPTKVLHQPCQPSNSKSKPYLVLIFGSVLRGRSGVGRRFSTRKQAERAGAAEIVRRRFQSQVPS